ncbi:MAG: hypothetical protein QXT86_09790, partial [Archaeoglobaceae archaeon]
MMIKDIIAKTNHLPVGLKESPIHHLTEEELNRLTLEFFKWYEEKPNHLRARYLLLFLFLRYTGARISEVIAIDETRDIDFKRSEIRLQSL